MVLQKRILVCPLNWGLGHATRCIPIIRLLLQKNAEVIIAAEGASLELLKKEFPSLQFIDLKGYNIVYPAKGSMLLKMLLSIPKIISGIIKEHKALKKIIVQHNINIVISDNRYGLWNNTIKSIFITHQLMVKNRFAENLAHRIILTFVKKYDECWIPDVESTDNLSGELSHKYPLSRNTFFIGTLSRFKKNEAAVSHKYDVLAIVSGPEPQRSIFKKLVIEQLKQSKLKALVICGKPQENQSKQTIDNLEIISHLTTEELQNAILQSNIIIARSGYSSIMDLAVLGKKAVFIPTPGQTEQEYLAEKFMRTKIAFTQTQAAFNLQAALTETIKYSGFNNSQKNNLLEKRINDLLR